MSNGFGVAELTTVIAPIILPETVGWKATFSVQNFFVSSVVVQVLLLCIRKSPDTVMLLSWTVVLVLFVILMALLALVVPTACEVNVSLAGVAVN
jgi:hypothetical protein